MVKLRAAHSNNPRLEPLRDGTVKATGIEFEWETMGPQPLFHHQLTQKLLRFKRIAAYSYTFSQTLSVCFNNQRKLLSSDILGGQGIVVKYFKISCWDFILFH